jgi:hypothetical protein
MHFQHAKELDARVLLWRGFGTGNHIAFLVQLRFGRYRSIIGHWSVVFASKCLLVSRPMTATRSSYTWSRSSSACS